MTGPDIPSRLRASSLLAVCSCCVLILFLLRFFLVAESAVQGETLWIVALWLGLLAVARGLQWVCQGEPIRRFDALDFSAGALVLGHVLSAFMVVLTQGDKRSAINLAWEWVGVFVAWILLRQEFQRSAFRQRFCVSLITASVCISGLGLYQHYIEFPQLARKYGVLFDRLKIATGSEKTQIQRELARDNIPTDGASLTLFEKRLRDSREPIGLFALANTLGGFLAVGLLLSIGLVRIDALRRSDLRWPFWVWIAMTLVISWCLLLTKSRTAWIGFFAGLAFGIVQAGYLRLTSRRILGLFAVVVVLAVSVWGLIQAGGLDRQVLTEAPKSLQYRLQYWQATLRLLADHPIWGVGPGQFRNLYLQYKLPEASEEIADPHNLLLDVAANGGLIGLCGLSACILLLLIQSGHRNSSTIDAVSGPQAANASKLFGLLGLLIWIGLFVTGFDDRLLVLLPAMLAVSWCLNRFISAATATSPRNAANPKGTRTTGAAIKESTKPTVLDPAASLRPVLDTAPVTNRAFVIGAAISLTIHLLGAGGIEMPAISLLWLSLVAAAKATDAQHTVQNRPGNFLPALGRMLAPSLVLVALIFSAILPNQRSQGLLSAGDRSIQRGDSGAAAQQYLESANADPFWAEPWRRRAELAFQSAQTSRFQSNETFLKAVNLLQESLNRDPFGHQDERKLSGWWKSKWEMSGDQHDLEEAVTQLQAVSRKYPTNALFLAELALLLNSKGDLEAAREMATRSLAQDEINHRWNHLDRYLPDSIRQQTQGLAGNRSPAE